MSEARATRPSAVAERYRPYPEYRETGVPWLPRIPAHWKLRRLKTMASVRLSNVDKKTVEGEIPVRLCNYTDVYYNERITAGIDFMEATATPAQVRAFTLRRGDVIITKDSEEWTDIAVPSYVSEDLPGVLCGYHLALLRPKYEVLDGRFLARACSAIGPRDQFQIAANGITRFGLSGDAIATALFGIPPDKEQQSIVAFLDERLGDVDALIGEKERLVRVLLDRRRAIIDRAVTGGLNRSARTRESGVPWLREIPSHWLTKRLKYLAEVNPESLSEDTDPGREILYVDIGNVDELGRIQAKEAMLFGAAPTRARRLVKHGDIIVSTVRTYLRAIARIVNPEPNLVVSTGFAVVRPGRELSPEYAAYALRSPYFVERVVAHSEGVSFPAINESEMATFRLVVPPLKEQRQIADYLLRETMSLDSQGAEIRRAIDSLKDLRTALVAAAVTGRIDVRGSRA
ncbi:MAG: restriction endonuclease subunit S [Chloroflexi bacterium]|nr:restriction endonuclease subunit S [Chloroflexota bacterium]